MKEINLSSFCKESRSDGKLRLEWNNIVRFLVSDSYKNIKNLSQEDILFSLEGFDWINADGLIWLLLLADSLKQNKNTLWLDLPRNIDQLEYIKASDFHRVSLRLFSITNLFYLDEIKISSLPKAMSFTKVDFSTLGSLSDAITSFLSLSGDFSREMHLRPTGEIAFGGLPKFLGAIKETTKNIVQHSKEKENMGTGYFVINTIGRNKFRIVIADAGRGFQSSLASKKITSRDDYDAIKRALLYRYHLDGEGLFRVVQFISHLNGVMIIRSGNGEAFLDVSKRTLYEDIETKNYIEERIRERQSSVFFPGVQILIDVKQTGL